MGVKKLDSLDQIRQIINIIFIITQIVSSYITNILGIGISLAESSQILPFPLLPNSFFFTIWGIIFPLLMAYGVFQATNANSTSFLLRKIGFKTAIAFFLTTVWLISTQLFNIYQLDFIFSVLILIFLIAALISLSQLYLSLSNAQYFFVYVPISAFTGWITVATLLTISSAIKYRLMINVFIPEALISNVLLICANLFVMCIFFITRKNVIYIIPVIWGMIGIWFGSNQIWSDQSIGICALICACILMLLVFNTKNKNKYIFKK